MYTRKKMFFQCLNDGMLSNFNEIMLYCIIEINNNSVKFVENAFHEQPFWYVYELRYFQ